MANVKLLMLGVLFLFFAGSVQANTFQTKRPDGSTLEYQLQIPSLNRFPLLIGLQGSGCETIQATGLKRFLPTLNALGFAILVVEKPGLYSGNDKNGCPEEYLKRNTIAQRVKDYQQVIAEVTSRQEFQKNWNGAIQWIGGSEGGTVASMAAPLFPQTTATALLASGGGMTMAKELKLLTQKTLKAKGKAKGKIDLVMKELEGKFTEIRKDPTPDKNWMGETNTYLWWASILDLDVAGSLQKLKTPVYVAHGTRDQSVPVECSDLLVKGKKLDPFGEWTYERYEDLDHKYEDSKGTQKGMLVFNSAILWLLVQEDQRLRRVPDFESAVMEFEARDQANLPFIKNLFETGQYPLISSHGLNANRNAWILVQHADSDPTFQKRVLAFLEQAHVRKDTYIPDLAYLIDRVMKKEGPQRFGTQYRQGKDGCWEPYPIEDIENVDARRKAYGLERTLAENTRFANEKYGKPECNKP